MATVTAMANMVAKAHTAAWETWFMTDMMTMAPIVAMDDAGAMTEMVTMVMTWIVVMTKEFGYGDSGYQDRNGGLLLFGEKLQSRVLAIVANNHANCDHDLEVCRERQADQP
jgi:hypothetical protein